MPVAGFRTIAGECVPLDEIDFIKDAPRFNCSPATLAMLIDSVKAREGIDFSASQLGSTERQQLLRASDYYPPTGQMVSGHFGTMKHQQVNVSRDGVIVEQRFTSKRNPRLSGQIDHAPVIEFIGDTPVVDLWDLKTVKWYSVTLIAKDIWKHHPDYAWQLNLCAAIMEEHGYRVRNLYLECIPGDSSYTHEGEAHDLGFPEFQKIIIPVERRPADWTYTVYEEALAKKDQAVADGYAPVCADRWSNRKVSDLRCKFYCDVREECIAFSLARGEEHPLIQVDDVLHQQLTRSLEATQ